MNLRHRWLASLVSITVAFVVGGLFAQSPSTDRVLLDVTVTVDFGADVGQNFGSLFEAFGTDGQTVAGAGFLGAYNTYPRSNRRRLHFFVKPRQMDFERRVLPRVNAHTGVYLSDQSGSLLARTRGGQDAGFYAWNTADRAWRRDEKVTGYDMDVAKAALRVREQEVVYGERTILQIDTATRIVQDYYANATLLLRFQDRQESATSNRLVAVPWTSDEATVAVDPAAQHVLALRSHGEFVYSFGQLGDELLATTNTGGVYVWSPTGWRVLVEPGPHSYQIYSIMNYYDRLLLGHYPSGELFEYDGSELRQLSGWPPVMPGVSNRAREAQTLAIYGGDLYAGVWPWGEVWRFDRNASQWNFVGRMFTHPAPTDATVHPYERETAAVNAVYNQWGQRVTSLVPFGESLFVGTSAKSGVEPVPEFLADGKWQDYGLVHEWRLPGQLSSDIDWKQGPTTLRCQLTAERMSLWQDGVLKAEQALRADEVLNAAPQRVAWGRGIYGPFRGDLLERRSNLDQPFLAAYVNLSQVFSGTTSIEERQVAIDRTLDRFRDSGLRVVMPYVTTTSGQAAYPSEIVEELLYDQWDPLAYLLAGAKERRLQVFPVFCVLACGHEHPSGILRRHPEWAVRDPQGTPIGYISPTHPDARVWVASVIEEVVRKYKVDGILLDYLRYHNRPIRLDARSEAEFERIRGRHAERSGEELFQQFREEGLTLLARQISFATRAVRPDLQIALYSWGPHVASKHRVGQAWPLWSRAGYVDVVNISGYCYPANYGEKYLDVFSKRLRQAVELNTSHHGRADVTFCLGLVTSHGSVQEVGQIEEFLVRAADQRVAGVAMFTWSTLLPYLDQVQRAGFIRAFEERVGADPQKP